MLVVAVLVAGVGGGVLAESLSIDDDYRNSYMHLRLIIEMWLLALCCLKVNFGALSEDMKAERVDLLKLDALTETVQKYKAMDLNYTAAAQAANGTGIIICAGGEQYLSQAFIMLVLLRDVYKVTLPVELFYAGDEEMPSGTRALYERRFHELRCVDVFRTDPPQGLPRMTPDHFRLNGFPIKPYALLTSRFHHALLLDADNLPVSG